MDYKSSSVIFTDVKMRDSLSNIDFAAALTSDESYTSVVIFIVL